MVGGFLQKISEFYFGEPLKVVTPSSKKCLFSQLVSYEMKGTQSKQDEHVNVETDIGFAYDNSEKGAGATIMKINASKR
jgi:hypothetical protein